MMRLHSLQCCSTASTSSRCSSSSSSIVQQPVGLLSSGSCSGMAPGGRRAFAAAPCSTRQPAGRRLALNVVQRQSNPRFARGKPEKFEPDVRMNDEIRCTQVRLIDEEREMLGVVSRDEALRMAEDIGVDLICINPDADPPVCRLVDYSKFKYELLKASKVQKKKQREGRVEVKELKIRPNTDVHDYQVRLRAAEKFIAKGNKVKLSCQFRGREMDFQDIGRDLFMRFLADLGDTVTVESGPNMANRTMAMVVVQAKKAQA